MKLKAAVAVGYVCTPVSCECLSVGEKTQHVKEDGGAVGSCSVSDLLLRPRQIRA